MPSKKNKSRSMRKSGGVGDSHSDIFSRQVSSVSGGRKRKSIRRKSGGGVMFPTSFANVPIRSFYSQNTFGSDPGYLTVGARNAGSFYGGKSRRQKTKRGKMRGGLALPSLPRMQMSTLYSASSPPKE